MHFRHEFTEDDMNLFMEQNPGITLEFVDGTDLTVFYAMYAAGTPPDLVRVQAPSVPQWLARGLLLNLTPYFETSQLIKMDDLMPANDLYKAESPLKVGSGPIYGMCKDFSPDLTVFINKEIFDKNSIPVDDTKSWSYAEIMDIAKTVLVKEGDRIVTFGLGWEGGWIDRYWMNSLAEKDLTLYSDSYDKMNLVSSEEAVAISKWYFDMMKDMLAYSAINPSPGGWMGNDFTAGQLAMCQYGFWYSAMAEGDDTKGKLMMMPGPNWAGQRRDGTITATGMIMTAATKVADAAWKTFEFYNAGEPSVARAGSGWGVPALKSQLSMIPQNTDFQKQAFKVLEGELALGTPAMQFNPFLGETQVPNAFTKYSEQALKNEITFEEMLQKIEDETNQAIQDGINNIMG
jgi:multiple sugar transport system substrate-binding protein